jgi:Transposase zinc-binding domain
MDRPPLEVADLVRAAGDAFIERIRKWITWKHVKVLLAIARCRTAALGGHLDECTRCGHRAISYNSCRNRHCPKCQAGARERWLEKRRRELLPTQYVHVVFTLPRHLAPLVLQNKKIVYDLLFRTSAETLLEVARDPKHLGAEIGFFSAHRNSSLLQVSIEFLCLSLTVVQFLFTTLTSLFHLKCNCLKARVVMYAYNHHVRLLVRRGNRRGEVNARSLDEGIASHIDPESCGVTREGDVEALTGENMGRVFSRARTNSGTPTL